MRSKIIKEHLHDPAYYEKMSALLDEIIAARKAKAIEYEAYLQRIAALAQQVEAGQADDTPEALKKSPALRALYNNLKKHDEQPEGWREQPKNVPHTSSPVIRCCIWHCRLTQRSSGCGPTTGAASNRASG